jgi:hypothetical protein
MSFVIGRNPSPLENVKVDSKEGIEHLFRWAAACGVVLDRAHEEIAKKYGVSTDGVLINHRVPK